MTHCAAHAVLLWTVMILVRHIIRHRINIILPIFPSYIWMNGTSGCLECAAVADSEGRVVPDELLPEEEIVSRFAGRHDVAAGN